MSKEKDAKGQGRGRFAGRGLLWRTVTVVLLFQLFAFAAAGALLYYVAGFDMTRDFYSAHRSIESARRSLLPAIAAAGAAGFALVALSTWLGVRTAIGRLRAPMERADTVLHRLAQGKVSWTPEVLPARERWGLDDAADAVVASYGEKIAEIKQSLREIHAAVLSLRYKATGSEPLTLKELRDITSSLDELCKKLAVTVKWFET